MNLAVLKNKWTKLLIAAIVIVTAGYLSYHYLLRQVAVAVSFNPDVTESAALQTLSKYKTGIATRTPKDYDYNFFNLFDNFKFHVIEFSTCRWCAYTIKNSIEAETGVRNVAIVENPPSASEDQQFYQYLQSHPITP